MSFFNAYVPTRILFGAGELNNLHTQKMPGKKAMIVISSGKSARANGYLSRAEEQLKLAGIETAVFDRVEANPLKSTVMAGSAFAKDNGCDFIVALGGGSSIDAAKAIAIMATNHGGLLGLYSFGKRKRQTGREQTASDCSHHNDRRDRLRDGPGNGNYER